MSIPINIGANVDELNEIYPETWLGYNRDDVLVRIRKYTVTGKKFERIVEVGGITDFDVAVWDRYRKWQMVQ